jgi:hypothetical protein
MSSAIESTLKTSMEHNGYKYYHCKQKTASNALQRASTDMMEATVDDAQFSQGRIFWLPPKVELPERAVKRAHGKGTIEDGIYDHPVVVVSRPAEESHIVHFHLVSITLLEEMDNVH